MPLHDDLISNMDSKFTEIMSGLQEQLGENVGIITYSKVSCPNCAVDPVSGRTAYYSPDSPWPSGNYPEGPKEFSGINCPYCNSKGSIETEQVQTVTAIVNWRRPSDWLYTAAGQVRKLTARIKTGVGYWDSFQNAKLLRINDMDFEIKSLNKSGLKTLNNLICEAEII